MPSFLKKPCATSISAALLGLSLPLTSAHAGGTIMFKEVPVPVTDTEKRRVISSQKVMINDVEYPTGYNIILRSGDTLNGQRFGEVIDIHGKPVQQQDGSPLISNSTDFSSLLLPKVDSSDSSQQATLYNVTHFELQPGVMYLTELSQNVTDGKLTPMRTRPIDFSQVWGGWTHCAGSVTPWNTHLGSEEYEPDAKLLQADGTMPDNPDYYGPGLENPSGECEKNGEPANCNFPISDEFASNMSAYFPKETPESPRVPGAGLPYSPYDYGYAVEVKVNSYDDVEVEKHYAMGRMALEVAYVMPDRRTTYLSDDGTGVILAMFVADREGELDSGKLYAAKWVQTSPDGADGGTATIEWADLGYARSEDIRKVIDAGIRFEDIFDTEDPVGQGCPTQGFVSVNHGHDTGQPYPGHECLRLKSGAFEGIPIETIASRLETRRYAAMMGATSEFRKMEGITYDPDNKHLYIAMSEINKGMESDADSEWDIGGPNDIRLAKNDCGAVYRLNVSDTNNFGILSQYVATTMEANVIGIPGGDENNTCELDNIANPDNITFIPGYATLIIGEDATNGHQNDAIWSYNVADQKLTRILTTPYGSETTSPYIYPDINGWAYLMSVVQHPYGEGDASDVEPADRYKIGTLADRAYNGYFVFPALK